MKQNPLNVVEESKQTGLSILTESGQSRLAYRLAAGILLVLSIMNVIDIIEGGGPSLVTLIIDLALAAGLFVFSSFVRTVTIWRVILGALLWPLVVFGALGPQVALITAVMQWGASGALLMLLTGRSTSRRLALSMTIFLLFTVGVYAGTWFLSLQAA